MDGAGLIRVLGPVRAQADGESIPIGGVRMRALLALLAAQPGRRWSAQELAHHLSDDRGDQPEESVIRVYVSRLRQRLTPLAPAVALHAATDIGYALDTDAVDHLVFRRLVEEGSRHLAANDPVRAIECVTEARSLWAGPPFDGLDLDVLAGVRAELEERNRNAAALHGEVLIELRRPTDAVSILREAVVDHPWDERIVVGLMLALYHSGRQRDALREVSELRTRLADVGLDAPGRHVLELQQQILTHDPNLATSTPPETHRTERRPLPAALDVYARRPFVGRDAELGVAVGSIIGTGQEARAPVVVEAPGGLGKTAFLTQLAMRLRSLGADTAYARCSIDPDIAGAPILDLLTVDPVLRRRLASVAERNSLADAAHHLVDEIDDWARRSPSRPPLTWLVDDIHLVDSRTLAVIRGLVRRRTPGLHLAFASRPVTRGSPWAGLRSDLVTDHSATMIELGPLDRAELAEFARLRSGEDPTSAEIDRLVTGTSGVPLLAVATDGRGQPSDNVPKSVLDYATRELLRLPSAGRSVVEAAAVLGTQVALADLAELLDHTVDDVAELVTDPLLRGLLGEGRSGVVEIEFVHDTFREAVLEQMSVSRRSALHAAATDLLEDRTDSAITLADHALRAEPTIGPNRTASIVLECVERSMEVGRYAECASIAERLLVISDRVDVARRWRVLVAHARAVQEVGGRRSAVREFARALDLAIGLGDHAAVVEIALRCARWTDSYQGEDDVSTLLERAEAFLRPRDPGSADVVLCEMVMAQVMAHRSVDATELMARLGDRDADRLRLPFLRAQVFLHGADPNASRRLETATELLRAASESPAADPVHRLDGSFFRLAALMMGGAPRREIDRERARFRELNAATGRATHVWLDIVIDQDLALDTGDLDAAVRHASRARHYGLEHDLPDATESYLGLRIAVAALLGDDEIEVDGEPLRLSEFLAAMAVAEPERPEWHAAASVFILRSGDVATAAEHVRLAIDLLETAVGNHLAPIATMFVGSTIAELADATLAERALPLAVRYSGSAPRMGQVGATLGPADRIIGDLHAVLGAVHLAIERYDACVRTCALTGGRIWQYLSHRRLASLVSTPDAASAHRRSAAALVDSIGEPLVRALEREPI